jgi:hypothetical protein
MRKRTYCVKLHMNYKIFKVFTYFSFNFNFLARSPVVIRIRSTGFATRFYSEKLYQTKSDLEHDLTICVHRYWCDDLRGASRTR